MRVAVDARFLQDDDKSELRDFTKEVFERLSVQHPTHIFILFTHEKRNLAAELPANVTIVVLTPKPTNFLQYKWWYDVKLPFALKKYKADVFIATYGFGSLTSLTKQVLIVRDLSFLNNKLSATGGSNSFYKRYTLRFISKSAAIVTLSNFTKEKIIAAYSSIVKNIHIVFAGPSYNFQPIDWQEREQIKEQMSEGCEYFIFVSASNNRSNFLNVLKAFSIFKKWQKTNMKLLVTGRFDAYFEKGLEKITNYKYRSDVLINRELSQADLSKLMAASYAMLYPSYQDGFATPVLDAMQCGVPVIGSTNSSMIEIAGDAALYADPEKPEDISDKMKMIFKDEQLRNNLREAARERGKMFSWDITAALLWKAVEEAVSQ